MEENKKFYSLERNTTFKYLLKNEKTRWFFERIVKHYIGIDLEGYNFIDNELNSGNCIKDFRLDSILVSPDKKCIVNLEMNSSTSNHKDLKLSRSRLYLYKIAGNVLKEGDSYQKAKDYTVEQINFNCFYCLEDKDVNLSTYQLVDSDNNLKIENFKIHNIYISRNVNLCYTDFDEELKLFMCKSYEELREVTKKRKDLSIIVDEIERLNNDKYFGALYNAEEENQRWINTGVEEGIKIGEKNEKLLIAKKLFEREMSIEDVSEITGLAIDDINNLGNK